MGWLALGVLPWLLHRKLSIPQPPRLPPAPELDEIIVARCAVALLEAGMPIPRVLEALGAVLGDVVGPEYSTVSQQLQTGSGWERSWQNAADPYRLEEALRAAWLEGINPTSALKHHIDHTLRMRINHAKSQAAILSVRIVLPLGLCLLPAFVLLGLVPSMLSSGIGLG